MLPAAVIAAASGDPLARTADKSRTMCPHGFYRCLGEDTWVALAVANDAQWAALRSVIAGTGVEVPPLATAAERRADEARVDAIVSAWTAKRSPWQVTWDCQREGIAAYPLQSTARLLWDDHLADRRFFSWVHRPLTGPSPLPGPVLRVGDGSRVRGYAPLLGEHNERVFRGLLEMDEEEYKLLVAAEVIA
jgi:benzylsuccinate CoA-transferase BbsF subunit